MKRWLIRIFISLAILVVALILIVQIVLWSPLPKRIVIQQIQTELGLRISADSLSTGWLGKSSLSNVSIGLPLSSADFLKVKTLKIKHSSLIALALGHVSVDSIEVDDPVVQVIQDANGQWNLQQVIDILGRVGGSNTATTQAAESSTVPVLPSISLVNGSVNITTADKRSATLFPLNVTGSSNGLLIWDYKLTIADSVSLIGKVAPGGSWQHQLALDVHSLDPLVKDWGITSTYGAAVKAHWDGQLIGGALTGQLTMDRVTAAKVPTLGDVQVNGAIEATSSGSTLTLRPHQLKLNTTYVTLPDVAMEGGAIISDETGLHAKSVTLSALGGQANLDANVDSQFSSGDLKATWSGLSLVKKTSQNGSLTASVRQPFAGQPVIQLTLEDQGTIGAVPTAGAANAGVAPTVVPAVVPAVVPEVAPVVPTPVAIATVANGAAIPTTMASASGAVLTTPAPVAAPKISRWNATLTLTGQGRSWQNIDWVLTAPQLTYLSGAQSIDFSQLSAHISQHLPVIELTTLSLPSNASATGTIPATFNSAGRIDFAASKWNFDAAGGFNTTFQNTPIPMTVALHAVGTNTRYDLKSLMLSAADLSLTADGSYDRSLPTPVDLHLKLSQAPSQIVRVDPDAPVQGLVEGEFKIVGLLFEERGHFRPYLTTTGDLRSSDLVVFNRPIGNIDIKLQGLTSSPKRPDGQPGPPLTNIHTTDFYLFQAPWDLTINYPDDDDNLRATLQTSKLHLEELARFTGTKTPITGQLASAKWTAIVSSANLKDLDFKSEYHLTDVSSHGVNIEKIDANLDIQDGKLKLEPLVAKSGNGTITTTALLDLLNPRHITTEAVVDQWPYAISQTSSAVTSAAVKLDIDLKSRTASNSIGANGSLTGSTDLLLGSTKISHADITAKIVQRAIDIENLSGNFLNGKFDGAAKLDLDKPMQAAGQLKWDNVDGAAIAAILPAVDGLSGKSSGTLTLAPARDPRPLEPVRLDINVATTDAHFRSMQIGGKGLLAMHAVAYLNTDRAVLDHSDLYLAGGVMHIWGRAQIRSNADLATQVAIDFANFDLDQLAHIDPKMDKPMPGILSGNIGLIRSGWHASQLLGQANLNLTNADLGNFGPVASLYNLMNVGSGPQGGTGKVALEFEQNTLRVTNFKYFNKGVEARGLAQIGPINYDKTALTPLAGQVVGSARALKDTKLPFLSDFDKVFSAFQGNLTTVNITGNLEKPKYDQGFISDIGKTMRQLLVGDAADAGSASSQ